VTGSDSVLRSPASMLRAASVAIVGASERARWASQIFGNLRHNGYGGKIHLVNPRQQTVYGERCFPSLRDIGAPVDHAMVIVPAANVADVLTDAYRSAVGTDADLGTVVLDFAAVDYINSTGIALIVSVLARARAERRKVVASGLSAHYREIFDITRLSDFIELFPDLDRAVSQLGTT